VYGGVTTPFRLFPQGCVKKASGISALDYMTVSNLIYSEDVILIVETEEHSPCHFLTSASVATIVGQAKNNEPCHSKLCHFTHFSCLKQRFPDKIYLSKREVATLLRVMAYLTKSDIRDFAQRETSQKAMRDYTDRAQFSAKHRVFLSHSHIDAHDISGDDVKNLIAMLITLSLELGYEVYIDWLDTGMPSQTSEITASRIKEKIDGSDRFLLAATTNAVNSRWVPWELGYADKAKGIDNIAVIPIADSSGQWEGAEYIRLYPTVQVSITNNLAVFQPSSTQNGVRIGYWMSYGRA
jgi:hypothetical protein